jgi:hypothetical protein
MKTKRRTEILKETREVTIIRFRQSRTEFCAFCQAEVWMLPSEAAAAFMQSTSRHIFRWIEAGKLHSMETGDGRMLVCRNSLETAQKGQKVDLL